MRYSRRPRLVRSIVYLDRRRPGRSRAHHRPRPAVPRGGRRRALRPPGAPAPAPPRARRRREDRRRRAPRRSRSSRKPSAICSPRRRARARPSRGSKWGDPFVFDRGGAEALFLHEQGVRFEVVPGIPAGIGVPSYAGVPITYPGGGDTLTFVRGHEDDGKTRGVGRLGEPRAARRHASSATPARSSCRTSCSALIAHGRPPDESAAIVYDGTLPTQETIVGSLDEIAATVEQSADRRPGDADRRPRRRAARAPALVRRAAAVRQAHPRHAAARAGGRARRAARGAWAPRRSRRR